MVSIKGSSAIGTTKFTVGTDETSAAARHWDGDIAEIIAYDTVLSDADRVSVQNYLQAKYFPSTVNHSGDFFTFF